MSENNSNDLFSKMLSSTPTQNAAPADKNENSQTAEQSLQNESAKTPPAEETFQSENTDTAVTDEDSQFKNDDSRIDIPSSFVKSEDSQKTFADSAFGKQKESHYNKKELNLKKISEKINIRLFAGIAVGLVVLIVLCWFCLGVILPAKTNASKIYNNFLDTEISDIYENKIRGNSLREKIFSDSLEDYPEKTKKAYLAEEISYDKATAIFSELQAAGFLDASVISENKEYTDSIKTSGEAFDEGEKLYTQGKYSDAILLLAKVITDDKNYDKAQEYITQCETKYKETVLSSSNENVSSGNYDDAIKILEEAENVLKDNSDITSALEKVKADYAVYLKNDALEKANALISEKKYTEAISLINTALEKNANDSELTALLNMTKNEYVTNVISQADALLEEYDYTGAGEIIDEALKVLPDNSDLAAKKETINSNKPTSLDTLVMINSNRWEWNNGAPKDPFENDYSDSVNYMIPNDGAQTTYGEFRLYKKYGKLTGRIAPYTDIGENDEAYIQIYADEQLVYTSPMITRKTDAFRFNVDIKNAEYIKIVCEKPNWVCSLILSDLVVYPN